MYCCDQLVCSGFLLLLAGSLLLQVVVCLKNVKLEIEPRVVQLGHDSTLKCSYDLEDAPLYCVKWYRGTREFYRYTPKEHPSTKIFAATGMHVDLKQSNEHQVVLREVGFALSGKFTCEVTADAPLFTAKIDTNEMLVVDLPKEAPTLTTEKGFYDIGDVLRANCSSPSSRPAATLTFFLNNLVVCEKCETHKTSSNERFSTDRFLELPLFPSHFHNGRLTLKCVAQIGDLYQRDAEISLYNVKDPVPARVTQSCAALCQASKVLGAVILLLPLLVYYL